MSSSEMSYGIQLARAGLLFSCGLLGGCDSSPTSAQPVASTADNPIKLRTEYWPADTATHIGDTTLHAPANYRLRWITRSLNDNAVLDTVQNDEGKFLIAAHNYETTLQVWHNGQPLFTTTLAKQLLGSSEEVAAYSWHGIAYQGYKNERFIFHTWIHIPDSDIGWAAEIAIDKTGKSHFVRVLDEERDE